MFIPCDHCLRKHANHVVFSREDGKEERLRLCDECYRRHREASSQVPSPAGMDATEREIAKYLQAGLLPQMVPRIPGFDVSAFYRPARELGGDYYDFVEIDSDRLGMLVADVSGRGVPGTIIMTETKALVKSESIRATSPAETLQRVNRVLYEDIKRGMFVTLYYVVFEPKRSRLTCVSAGHNPLVLWRRASNTLQLINPNGIALGIDRGPLFERTLKEQTVELSQGDRFVLYSDGATESMNRRNEPFGASRFYLRVKQLADKSSSEFLSQLTQELDLHQGDAPQHDDITILTGRVV